MAVIGGLILLLAEASDSTRTMFAGLPVGDVSKTGNYLQVCMCV